jgi:hypothetical protein
MEKLRQESKRVADLPIRVIRAVEDQGRGFGSLLRAGRHRGL